MEFQNLKKIDNNTYSFTLNRSHVSYANTLRRLILTGVETIAFRADMTSTGTTTDVLVKSNTTPMTNEMLAHRVGLLPLNVKEPLKWDADRYVFKLVGAAKKDSVVDVCAGDFQVFDRGAAVKRGGVGSYDSDNSNNSSNYSSTGSSSSYASSSDSSSASSSASNSESSGSSASSIESLTATTLEETQIPARTFFPPHPVTGDTSLIATFPAGSGQVLELTAKATIGTGRENARFMPVSQCSYEYSRDPNPERQQKLFERWLLDAKKVVYSEEEAETEKIKALKREYNTMEVARCYLQDEATGEPYSFDFTVESVGVLDVPYIVKRACEVGRAMVGRYVNIEKGKLPEDVSISPAEGRVIGFDFLFKNQDHTLGNLLQTWLVNNHIDGEAKPAVTFAGYKVPHPLRDEMVVRVGVEDGQEATARLAIAMACRGCVEMFDQMLAAWATTNGLPATQANAAATAAKRILRRATTPKAPVGSAKAALAQGDDGGVYESKTGE
jgi:DNA-directed RNA polymerase subunit L/DNA-directed RNA polymerase alpha subunit